MSTQPAEENAPKPPSVAHIDFVALTEGAKRQALDALFRQAAELATMREVVEAAVIEADRDADFDLAFLFVLRDFAALEPFGTNPMYSRFLQGHVAPVLRLLAGADVMLEGDMPAVGAHAACLALAADEETYDWEVSEALKEWTSGYPRAGSVTGLAVGERQRYRGVGLAFSDAAVPYSSRPPDDRFSTTFVMGKARSLR